MSAQYTKACHLKALPLARKPNNNTNNTPPPPSYLPASNARSSELAVYSSDFVVVDLVEVNVIMGAGTGSLVVDAIVVVVILLTTCNYLSLQIFW